MITQLNAVLDTINSRSGKFDDLIVTLQQFTTGLAQDREAILGSLGNISGVADATAGLLGAIRPDLKTDIDQLGQTAALLALPDKTATSPDNANDLNGVLNRLPRKVNLITGTATYGSWFNFYLCMQDGTLTLPDRPGDRRLHPAEQRCEVPEVKPFRSRNPVVVGAVGLTTTARPAGGDLQPGQDPAVRGGGGLQRRVLRGQRHQGRRRGPHRRA